MVLVHKITAEHQGNTDMDISDQHPPSQDKESTESIGQDPESSTQSPSRYRTRSTTSGKPRTRTSTTNTSHPSSKRQTPKRPRDSDTDKQGKRQRDDSDEHQSLPPSPPLSTTPDPQLNHTLEGAVPPDGQHAESGQSYYFLDIASNAPDRRGPRARAAPPVPVPNLTKKSRGRRVPTKPLVENGQPIPELTPASTRIYVCKVEDCGKCFNRGEHLKRHIRSIHTHEKPFKCTIKGCEKFFNRHDNLLQHLKVHKPPAGSRDDSDTSTSKGYDGTLPTMNHTQGGAFPTATRFNMVFPPRFAYRPHTPMTGVAGGDGPSGPPSFATNMAVSSLRTEMPSSPVEMTTCSLRPTFTSAVQPRPTSPPNDANPANNAPAIEVDPALATQ